VPPTEVPPPVPSPAASRGEGIAQRFFGEIPYSQTRIDPPLGEE
jgi:hypothetical protein